MEKLKDIWYNLASAFSGDKLIINELWEEIVKNHSSSKRKYHNLHHLEYMTEKAFLYKTSFSDLETVLFSIFYHDIVYKVLNGDNEEKSAEVAGQRLKQLGVPNDQITKCINQILATKTHKATGDKDTLLLLDIDLAILGESPEVYQEYTQKIRKEYSLFPDFMYNQGRKKVILNFLEMERIFKTEDFYRKYEKQAKENLASELKSL